MTARLVWQYHHTPETFSDAMGSVQRLPNGNTVIGWGDDSLLLTELDPKNVTLFEAQMPLGIFSYRVYKETADTTSGSAGVTVSSNAGAEGVLRLIESAAGTVRFAIGSEVAEGMVTLTLSDALGRPVRLLSVRDHQTGIETVGELSVAGLPSGCYYLTAHTAGAATTIPVGLLR